MWLFLATITFTFLSILLEAEHLVKHLHLSRHTDYDSTSTVLITSYDNEKSPKRFFLPEEVLSINERLYINFTETCPLFLLKEGIDHRFEFLDFAPDLYIRQTFHPISQDELISNNTDIQIDSTNPSSTHLFPSTIPQITEIE